MKEILQDIVSHTRNLGFLNVVKITGDKKTTKIDSMADDRSVILFAQTNDPYPGMSGVFGMPQLNKLKFLLDCNEYKENAKITVTKQKDHDGEDVPSGIHFENKTGDFKNDYRFMSTAVINDQLKNVKMKPVKWGVEVVPTNASIQKLKFQSQAHSDATAFSSKTENGELKFFFGDHSTHSGNFVFHPDVNGTLSKAWQWPVKVFLSIMDLTGDKMVRFTDAGAAEVTIDSGLANYRYLLPAQAK